MGGVGVILAAGGRIIGRFLPFAGLGVGVIIAALGLYLLLSKRKLGIMAASRVNLGQGKGVWHIFLFGIAYAVASLSCALPIFLAAIGIVAGQSLSAGTVAETIIGSITYGLGMGSVLVAATLGVVFFKGLAQRGLRAVFPYIEPIGNLAMVGRRDIPDLLLDARQGGRIAGAQGRADILTSLLVARGYDRVEAAPHVVVPG